MSEIENKIRNLEDWPLFCKAKSADDESCSDLSLISPIAYLNLFAGKDWKQKSQHELDDVWKRMRSQDIAWSYLKFLFNKEIDIENTGKVNYMRFVMNFGAPLDMSNKKSLNDS